MPSLMVMLGLNNNSFAAGLNQSVSKAKVSSEQIARLMSAGSETKLNRTISNQAIAPQKNLQKIMDDREAAITSASRSNKARQLMRERAAEEQRAREASEKEELQSAVRSASRSNSARRILRQRAAAQEMRETVSAQQRTDAAIEQITRDNLARRLRRERAMKQAEAARDRAEQAQRGSFGGRVGGFLSGAVSGVGAQIAAVAAPVTAFFAAKKFVGDAIGVDMAYQRIFNTLMAGTGSVSQAKEEFEFLRGAANKTGGVVSDIGDDYAKMMLAAKGLGLSIADTRRIFVAFSTAGASLGLPADRQKMMMLAINQMMAKTKISMEELKRQLGEHLPMALSLFATGMGVSVDQMIKLIETGNVSADVLTKVATVIENSPDLQRVNETTVAIGQMKNAWEEIKAAFGAEIRPEVLGFLGKVTVALRMQRALQDARSGKAGPMKTITDALLGKDVRPVDIYYQAHKDNISKLFKWMDSTSVSKKLRDIMEGPKLPTAPKGDSTPDFRFKQSIDEEGTERIKIAERENNLVQQIADEEKKRDLIGLDAAGKRLKLQQEILRAELMLLESAPGAEEMQSQLDLLKAKNALSEFDVSNKESRASHSVNELQRVGAYSAQSINTSILNEARMTNGYLFRMVKVAEARTRTPQGGTNF